MMVIVDFSHVHRPTTGLERVSYDLFSGAALQPIPSQHIRATSNLTMVLAQWLRLPLHALLRRHDLLICPGFPPSLALMLAGGSRVIPYIHDMFLSLRKQDLNSTAKYYMRPSFKFAVRHARHFLVNSVYTQGELRAHCSTAATIQIVRPPVHDVFGLADHRINTFDPTKPLRLVTIGTLEPRKNLRYAVAIRHALADRLGRAVELHIIGRKGWGVEADWIAQQTGVITHGYLAAEQVRAVVGQADLFISTSLEEGLGLPLLEVQHGGLCVVASDIPVYQEVLGQTGCLMPLNDASHAAQKISDLIAQPDWKNYQSNLARANVAAWIHQATQDRHAFLLWLSAQIEQRI